MRISPKLLAASLLAAMATAGHVVKNAMGLRGTPYMAPRLPDGRRAFFGGGYTIRYSRRHGRKLKPNAAQRRRMPAIHP